MKPNAHVVFFAGALLGALIDQAVGWWVGSQALRACHLENERAAIANCRLVEVSEPAGIRVDRLGVSPTEWRARCDELEARSGAALALEARSR